MENYFLKSSDGKKMYRIEYENIESLIHVGSCHVSAANVTLPGGALIDGVDLPVEPREILVDVIMANVSVSDVASYRTLAKSISDAEIDARW